MSLLHPHSIALEAILQRIMLVDPDNDLEDLGFKYVDQDLGQAEGNSVRDMVAYPHTLIDFSGWVYSDLGNGGQMGVGNVIIKLGFAQFTPTSGYFTPEFRAQGLQFYEMEQKLHARIHNWSPDPDTFSVLTRTNVDTRNLIKGIRQRVLTYKMAYQDYSTKQSPIMRARPDLDFEGQLQRPGEVE